MSKKLEELFKEASKGNLAVDRHARIDMWNEELVKLYSQVTSWLDPAISKGYLKVNQDYRSMTEERLGEYKAPVLILKFGADQISFVPRGLNVIGARGRVDIVYKDEVITRLVLLGENERPGVRVSLEGMPNIRRPEVPGTLRWNVVNKMSKNQVYPFSETAFEQLLEDILG